MRSEIFEQPRVLERVLRTRRRAAGEVAEAVRRRRIQAVLLAARGSSDNAALYGKYLLGWLNRLPVALAAPSLFTLYRSPPRLAGMLVAGISQSGESPDIVGVVREARSQGAPTLAITNHPSSPLARAAELLFDTCAGPELAVAATKSYTAQLLALAMLGVAASGDARRAAELERVPELVRLALELDDAMAAAAARLEAMERCVVLGRGFDYATAFEWSLKLKEMSRVVAEPYSSADFRHGPIALVEGGFPVLAVAPGGRVHADLLALLGTLAEQGARLLVVSDQEPALALAELPVRLPAVPEWLSPLVSVVPAQLFCHHLARRKGLDPDRPRRLEKITRTL